MRQTLLLAAACFAAASFAAACRAAPLAAQPAPAVADLIVTNARIHTVDEARPRAEALVVKDGRVLFVGPSRFALAHRGTTTRVVDAAGRTIIPGMTDAHGHVVGLGQTLQSVNLVGTTSIDQVVAKVVERARATPKGQWIVGRGWDQNDWGDTRFPTHEVLSRAVPDHPVFLVRVDGHAAFVNAAAMRLAGVGRETKDPDGGRLERDAQGMPTGVLVDRAMGLVGDRIPPMSDRQVRDAILAAVQEMHRWGLTGVHDAGASAQTLAQYETLARTGAYDLRLYAMIGDDAPTLAAWYARGPLLAAGDGRLWVRSIKLYGDGALGSRGAAMLDPYSDDPHNHGLVISDAAYVERVATAALKAGFQVCTHAIGDKANRNVLDAYDAALRQVPVADHRFRVEHAQIVSPADLPRFAALGVIPSMQASHQTSDMYWAEQRIGSTRVLGAYAWRSLLDQGSIIPNGSDFPVEAVNPLISFHASIARQDEHNWPAGGWHAEQRMTREEALRSMTLWPAMAAFQERELGSLTAGKRADFVVLDRDLMSVPAEDVLGTRVLQTWVGGKLVYEAK
ncbi:MAG: amidohydrolase [Gemmatimonadaceae bacterium]|nr:amidohydrolase [Gemmatimonadaceae bacterium]